METIETIIVFIVSKIYHYLSIVNRTVKKIY